MLKKFLSGIWNFSLKKGWNWVWSKTDIDEKAVETAKEIKRRYKKGKRKSRYKASVF